MGSGIKRRFPRMTVRITVTYDSDGGTETGTATTLGAGGLFIETDQMLERGEHLKLRFRLLEDGRDHEIQGRVSWRTVEPVDYTGGIRGPHNSGFGVQFLDPVGTSLLARELELLGALREAELQSEQKHEDG